MPACRWNSTGRPISAVTPPTPGARELPLADPTYFKFWSGVNVIDPVALKTGSLVVDLQDAASGTIVWRGLATATVDQSFEKIGRAIDKSVARMFREFPPRRP